MATTIRSGDKLFVQEGFLSTVRKVNESTVEYTNDGTGDYANKVPEISGTSEISRLQAFGPGVWRKHHSGIVGSCKVQLKNSGNQESIDGVSESQIIHKAVTRIGLTKLDKSKSFNSLKEKMSIAHELGRRELYSLFHTNDPTEWFVVKPLKAVKERRAVPRLAQLLH